MILWFTSWAMACAPTMSVALDILIELRAFLLELESRFLDLLMSSL